MSENIATKEEKLDNNIEQQEQEVVNTIDTKEKKNFLDMNEEELDKSLEDSLKKLKTESGDYGKKVALMIEDLLNDTRFKQQIDNFLNYNKSASKNMQKNQQSFNNNDSHKDIGINSNLGQSIIGDSSKISAPTNNSNIDDENSIYIDELITIAIKTKDGIEIKHIDSNYLENKKDNEDYIILCNWKDLLSPNKEHNIDDIYKKGMTAIAFNLANNVEKLKQLNISMLQDGLENNNNISQSEDKKEDMPDLDNNNEDLIVEQSNDNKDKMETEKTPNINLMDYKEEGHEEKYEKLEEDHKIINIDEEIEENTIDKDKNKSIISDIMNTMLDTVEDDMSKDNGFSLENDDDNSIVVDIDSSGGEVLEVATLKDLEQYSESKLEEEAQKENFITNNQENNEQKIVSETLEEDNNLSMKI